jgi:hypothetical protein
MRRPTIPSPFTTKGAACGAHTPRVWMRRFFGTPAGCEGRREWLIVDQPALR